MTARADAGLSRASLEKVRNTLSQVLNWAVRREIVFRNIASVIEPPASSRPAKEGRSLTLDQAQSLLAAASGTPLEAMWTTMLFLGLRPGEAAGLSWPDIDFESGVIHIWRARRRDATGRSVIADSKTGHRDHVVAAMARSSCERRGEPHSATSAPYRSSATVEAARKI